jgi:DNA-binding response OmpR family regulator
MRVLVVEDEVDLAEQVADGLRDEGMAVDLAFDGAEALDKYSINTYDVAVLDRDLPKIHGDAVCSTLVAMARPTRILMLTAAGDTGDRIAGLALGADDYLPKPFAFAELVLRVRSLARRAAGTPRVLIRGDLEVDPIRRTATRAGRSLPLSLKELAVLEVLLSADGAPVSSEELLERVWDENADPFTRTVGVTVGRLRRKLGAPPLIHTIIGVGYHL